MDLLQSSAATEILVEALGMPSTVPRATHGAGSRSPPPVHDRLRYGQGPQQQQQNQQQNQQQQQQHRMVGVSNLPLPRRGMVGCRVCCIEGEYRMLAGKVDTTLQFYPFRTCFEFYIDFSV